MSRFTNTLVAAALATAAVACGDATTDAPTTGAGLGTTGMALTAGLPDIEGVADGRYTIERVACPGDAEPFEPLLIEADSSLVSGPLPAGIVEAAEVDDDSAHRFMDHFQVVPPGCYDVTFTPLDDAGEPSDACSGAAQQGVEVFEGETTEIALYSQCDGIDNGAIDAIILFNHPPTIVDVEFEPSKFVPWCEPAVICATAGDVDRDPVEIEWTQDDGAPLDLVEISSEITEDGDLRVCVQTDVEAEQAYTLTVRAYDLMADGTRIEDFIGQPSVARLTHPLYGIESPDCED